MRAAQADLDIHFEWPTLIYSNPVVKILCISSLNLYLLSKKLLPTSYCGEFNKLHIAWSADYINGLLGDQEPVM
jgi:hypothetical protein